MHRPEAHQGRKEHTMKTTTTTRINDTVITTERCWDYDSVRTCCIRNNLYTCGTCKQYEVILQFVEENGPTTENVYTVALDIWAHSDDQTVTNIMHHLERDAIRTYFETEIAEDALDEALAQEAEEELEACQQPGDVLYNVPVYVHFNFGSYAYVGVDVLEGLSFEECVILRSEDVVSFEDPDTSEWHDVTVTVDQAREHLLALRSPAESNNNTNEEEHTMTTGEIEVLKIDRDAWKATAQDLQNAVKKLTAELEQAEQTKGENTIKELATLITDACFHYDPYNGADYEDVLEATEEGLKDPDRMRDMLEELARMLLDM